MFSAPGGLFIDTGTTSYECSTSNGQEQCVAMSSTENPLASLAAAFNPATALGVFQGAEAQVEAHAAGFSIDVSSGTYAGLPSKCITGTGDGKTFKYCVTDTGILAYGGGSAAGSGGSFAADELLVVGPRRRLRGAGGGHRRDHPRRADPVSSQAGQGDRRGADTAPRARRQRPDQRSVTTTDPTAWSCHA